MTTPLKLLLVDGHYLVRQTLAERLRRHPGVGRVVTTECLAAAIGLIAQIKPDLVICDPRTLGQEADACVRQLSAAGPPILVLTSSIRNDELTALRQAGAVEVMLKGVGIPILLGNIERIVHDSAAVARKRA
jgi:DNA-binding NarL/FixJ family response regulator